MLWSLLSAAVPDVAALSVHGPLPVCPDRPNCVCSEEGTPEDRRVDSFPGSSGDALACWATLKEVLADAGADVKHDDGVLLHAVFRTPVLRFPDDFLARLDNPGVCIQVRSSSRVGRSDLGTNRRRVERLRAAYTKRLGEAE